MLQSEGLVESVPHVGTTVTPLSRESILDVFTIMEGLQIVAARRGAPSGPRPATSRSLDRLMREMDAVVESNRLEVWGDFQHAVPRRHRVGGRPADAAADDGVGVRPLESDAPLFFSTVLAVRARQAQREHHAIVAAMRTRTLDRLAVLVSEHNQHALNDYLHHLDSGRPAGDLGATSGPRSTREDG